MLIDDYMPVYDARESHETHVRASASHVFTALHSANLAGSVPVRVLMALRGVPAVLLRRETRSRRATGRAVRLADLEAYGFRVLQKVPPSEVVLGVDGTFWTSTGGVRAPDPATFRDAPPPGTARAAWNFHIADRGDGSALLSTETRVRCADDASRRRFRVYWLIARPGSGLIRRSMLRSIRSAAERAARVVAGTRP